MGAASEGERARSSGGTQFGDGGLRDDEPLTAVGAESKDDDGGGDDWEEGIGVVRTPGWLNEQGRTAWRDRIVPERFRGTRLDPGRRGVVTLALVGLMAVVVATVVVLRERPVAQAVPPLSVVRASTTVPAGPPSNPAQQPSVVAPPGGAPMPADGAGGELVVSVVGLVHNAGLLRLPSGSRVADAIGAAGGVRAGADLTGLNLAQRLQDGDQVLVGAPGANPGTPQLGSTTLSAGGRGSGSSAPQSGAPTPSARVDLNAATESELDTLPGIGPVTARAIVAWRSTNGRFTAIEQLGEVDGIGPARLARLRDLVKI